MYIYKFFLHFLLYYKYNLGSFTLYNTILSDKSRMLYILKNGKFLVIENL